MKQLIYLVLLAVSSMVTVSCKSGLPDYENLSKEELTQLHNDGDVEATLQLGRLAIHEMIHQYVYERICGCKYSLVQHGIQFHYVRWRLKSKYGLKISSGPIF